MDAKVHNECERHFLRALDAIKQYAGDFQIEVSVPNEGGYIDEFLITMADSSFAGLIRDFVAALITYFFMFVIKLNLVSATNFKTVFRFVDNRVEHRL